MSTPPNRMSDEELAESIRACRELIDTDGPAVIEPQLRQLPYQDPAALARIRRYMQTRDIFLRRQLAYLVAVQAGREASEQFFRQLEQP